MQDHDIIQWAVTVVMVVVGQLEAIRLGSLHLVISLALIECCIL